MRVLLAVDGSERSEAAVQTIIVDAAREWPADLIVLGSHGRRGLDRLLLGSVAESAARHAPCSVDIVRAPVAAADRDALQSRHAAHP